MGQMGQERRRLRVKHLAADVWNGLAIGHQMGRGIRQIGRERRLTGRVVGRWSVAADMRGVVVGNLGLSVVFRFRVWEGIREPADPM